MVADVSSSVQLVEGINEVTLVTQWLPGRVRVVTQDQAGPILDAAASFIGPKELPVALVSDGDRVFFLAPGEWSIIVAATTFGTERRDLDIGPDEDSLVVIAIELEAAKVEVTKVEMVILEKILFEVGSSGVNEASLGLLQEVANNIVNHGEIEQIEVHGHTDATGSATANRTLSQSRVEAVVAELIRRGVAADILVAIGHGEDDPIAPNDTEEGRAENRRVQFLITSQE
jgi:outer membrane protein OmpA-like peptidoglycan-associated protein